MQTPGSPNAKLEVGDGGLRPIVVHLLAVAVGVAGLYGSTGRSPEAGPILVLYVALVIGCIPAVVLTLEFGNRIRPTGWVARAAIGAVAWMGWGLFVAVVLATIGGLVLRFEVMGTDLTLTAAAGAIFATFGLMRELAPSRRSLVVAGLVVTFLVVIGAGLVAGQWGSAA